MKEKYFAYLHRSNHWVLKRYIKKKQFMDYLQDGFSKNSNVIGIIMPFQVDIPENNDHLKPSYDPIKGTNMYFISVADIEQKCISNHPALLYLKNIISKIDWNKG